MPGERDTISEREQQLEAAESGVYGHAQQHAVPPDSTQVESQPQAASDAAEGGTAEDNYLAEARQLDAKPPLPPSPGK